MIPANFDYIAAKSLDEALSLLAKHKDDAKLLAGGHSLLPAMKLRLAQPKVLIDLGKIKDLSYIKEESGQVRNKGTIGGSLAHSDPAADWPAAVLAVDAELVLANPKGERVIKAVDFFVDLLTTALQPGEVLKEIRFATAKGRVGQAYLKVRHPASGFAVVGIAANLTLDASGKCQSAGIGVTGVGLKAYRAGAAESALKGKSPDAKTLAAAAEHAADGVETNSDLFASGEYRKHLAQVYTRRALETVVARAI